MKTLKLLRVNHSGGSVSGEYDRCSSVSGYRGHDWTQELGADTVGIDARPVSESDAIVLAISGPMPGVDLPPGTVHSCMDDAPRPYVGEARALDCVSLDVYCDLWAAKGAVIIRGESAIRAFAAVLSKPRW